MPHDNKEKWEFSDVEPSVMKNTKLEITKVNWFSTYRVHHRLAQRFRNDRIFLCGDAAHLHSPVGGQGMIYSHFNDLFNHSDY